MLLTIFYSGILVGYWFDGFRWDLINGIEIIWAIVGTLTAIELIAIPFISSCLDFLWFTPLALQDLKSQSHLQAIYHSPVETSQILKDLRRWAFRINFNHLGPPLALLTIAGGFALVTFQKESGWNQNTFQDIPEIVFLNLIPIPAVIFSMWIFFLVTGLASAGLPRWSVRSGLILLGWIIPVLTITFWGGSVLANEIKDFVNYNNLDPYISGHHISYEHETFFFCMHYVLFLSIASIVASRRMKTFMENRRNGVWE